MNTVRIVHVVLGKANPNRMNGVNRVVHFLASAQVELGKKVEVWGLTSDKAIDDSVVRNYELKLFVKRNDSFIDCEGITDEVLINRNTIFHFHGGFIRIFSQMASWLKEQSLNYIFTPHGCFTDGARSQGWLKKFIYYRLYEKRMMENARFVQCLGYQEEADLKDLNRKAKSILVPNGQEPIETKYLGEKGEIDHLIFGYCGRLSRHHKGLDILIDGFIDFILETRFKHVLWIIGDGEYMDTMKEKVEASGLEEQVVFYGKKFGEEKFDLISQMDVFFHPSRHEGLPTAVLEACYLGVPSAVTPQTSFDRYIQQYDAGWLIEKTSRDAVYSTMLQISLDNKYKEVKTKSKNAKNMIRNDFTWLEIAKKLNPYYQQAI